MESVGGNRPRPFEKRGEDVTNEELAVAIQDGDSSLSEMLWDQVKGFVWKQARRWAAAWHSRKYFDGQCCSALCP